jgi:hypothetical protein
LIFIDFSWRKVKDFLSVQIISCTALPSRKWLFVQIQISALSLNLLTQQSTVLVSKVSSPQKANNPGEFNGSFIFVHQKLNNSSLSDKLQYG